MLIKQLFDKILKINWCNIIKLMKLEIKEIIEKDYCIKSEL